MSISTLSERFSRLADFLQTPLLFVVRTFWGWQFAQTGWGKLTHLDQTTEFFASLNLPAPKLNAMAAGGVELVGGCLLILGLFSRFISVPLIFTMIVAYVTADHEALAGIFKNPDGFTSAAPFLFLFSAVIVLAFGPGRWSVDGALAKRNTKK